MISKQSPVQEPAPSRLQRLRSARKTKRASRAESMEPRPRLPAHRHLRRSARVHSRVAGGPL